MQAIPQAWNADQNVLLGALSPSDRERLLPDLQSVTFSPGQVLFEPAERIRSCYFLTSAVVSLLYTMRDGSTAEMALVGKEGVVGIHAYLGKDSTCCRAITVVGGRAFKIPAKRLQEEFARAGSMQALLLRYTQAFIIQVSQTAVCNRLHSMEQRLCRWLLLCLDRRNCAELEITQETIASILGGRRESVTIAAGHLQDAGLIYCCRGHIRILDRSGLEAHVCECYQAVEDELDSLFACRRRQESRSISNDHVPSLRSALLLQPRRQQPLRKNSELGVA